MSFIMTKQEREAFLADVHVGIISVSEEGSDRSRCRWYAYDSRGDPESCLIGVAQGSLAHAGRQI